MPESEGTYRWRTVAEHAIVVARLGNGLATVAAPTAKEPHHRLVTAQTWHKVGTLGELRFVSNSTSFGFLQFMPNAADFVQD